MRDLYKRIARGARRFFAATGIPVPGLARRVHRAALNATAKHSSPKLEREIEAQRKAIERLEVVAYIDRIGRRED